MSDTFISPDSEPAIRREEARFRPRIARAYNKFVKAIQKEIDKEALYDAIESGDERRVMLLYEQAAQKAGKVLFGVFKDAMEKGGKITEREINASSGEEGLTGEG